MSRLLIVPRLEPRDFSPDQIREIVPIDHEFLLFVLIATVVTYPPESENLCSTLFELYVASTGVPGSRNHYACARVDRLVSRQLERVDRELMGLDFGEASGGDRGGLRRCDAGDCVIVDEGSECWPRYSAPFP